MIIKLEKNSTQKDIEVLIKYAQMNQTVKRIEGLIKSVDKTVKCKGENNELWINASDIYYIESVDKRTFVYCEKSIYRSDLRLYQLIDELMDVGFVRVSKSCIMNINMLDSIRTMINSKMEATLSNGERICITRKFIPCIRKKLEER